MKIRNIQKTFSTLEDLGFKNLLVSGCSFTYNNHDECACTWPYYLRDLGNFESVFDCSLPGAGNKHIHDSTIYSIEQYNIDPLNTLTIVLWSGNDRDDFIIDSTQLTNYPFQFNYTTQVSSGISGGAHDNSHGNTDVKLITSTKQAKSLQSRAIENYIHIVGLYHYLLDKGFKFLFLEYRDFDLPAVDHNFNIRNFLPLALKENVNQMITPTDENFYRYCLRRNLLEDDDFHPTPNGHLEWTKDVLFPMLSKNY